MMARTSAAEKLASCASAYAAGCASPSPCGKSEPKTIGSMPISATTRCTLSSGNGATTKWSRKISDGRRSRRPVSEKLALRPIRKAWSILRMVYGTHTVPCSDRQTFMFGNRSKKFCSTKAEVSSIAGRSPQ